LFGSRYHADDFFIRKSSKAGARPVTDVACRSVKTPLQCDNLAFKSISDQGGTRCSGLGSYHQNLTKRECCSALTCDFGADIRIITSVNRADSSNIGGSYAKNQQEAQEVSQRPCEDSTLSQPLEYFSDNFEDTTDFTLNESFEEPFNSLDGTVDSVTEEQVKELFSLLTKDADWTSDEQVEEAVNNLEVTADSASGEQSVFANSSEDTVNPQLLSQTDNSASNESLEDYINSVGETFDQASGGQLKEFATDEEALDDFFKILYEALN